jgi:hypothetical protein
MEGQMETVACELKYSGVGMAFLLLATAATLALVLAMPLDPAIRAPGVLYVAAQSARACRAMLAPIALRLHRTREIHVCEAGGAWVTGELRDGSFVLPWLTIVRWRPAGARTDRTLVLVRGMATDDNLRKIRVILRFS